jgi:hypothetical protein
VNNPGPCPLCECYHLDVDASPWLNQHSFRDALFAKTHVELTDSEALALLWLASISDCELRQALLSLFQKARTSATR